VIWLHMIVFVKEVHRWICR